MYRSLASIFAINQFETNIAAINKSLTSIAVEMSKSEAITIPGTLCTRTGCWECRGCGSWRWPTPPASTRYWTTSGPPSGTTTSNFYSVMYLSNHVFQGVISILAYISFKIILLRNLLVTLIYRTIILLSIHSETTLTLIGWLDHKYGGKTLERDWN